MNNGHHDVAALLNDWTLGTNGQQPGPPQPNTSGPLPSVSPSTSGGVQSPSSTALSPNTQSTVVSSWAGVVPTSTMPQHFASANFHKPGVPSDYQSMPALKYASPWPYSEMAPIATFSHVPDRRQYHVDGGVDRTIYPPVVAPTASPLVPVQHSHLGSQRQPNDYISTDIPSHATSSYPVLAVQQHAYQHRMMGHHASQWPGNSVSHRTLLPSQTAVDSARLLERQPYSESSRVPVAGSTLPLTHKHSPVFPPGAVPIHPYPSPPYNAGSGKPSPQQVALRQTSEATYLTPSPEAQSSPEGWSTESPNGHSDCGGCWSVSDNQSPPAVSTYRINKGFHQPAATKPLSHFPHRDC